MKVAIDFENTLTKFEVFEFANDLLNEGIEVHVLTSKIGHIKSDYNKDILKAARGLNIPYANVIFTNDKRDYFLSHKGYEFYLSDNLIDLQLVDGLVKTVPIFGNKNWKRECLGLVGCKA